MVLFVVAAAVLIGCGDGEPPLPINQAALVAAPEGADAAIDHCMAAFAIPSSHRPTVYWQGAAGLDCRGGLGFTYGGQCFDGLEGIEGILLALPDVTARPSQTQLAHELAHWKWNDHNHANLAIWGPDSTYAPPGTIVGDENAALAAAGL